MIWELPIIFWIRSIFEPVKRTVALSASYGYVFGAAKIEYLKGLEELSEVDAIKNDRFVSIPFFSVMPGVQNADVVKAIASELYPDVFTAE